MLSAEYDATVEQGRVRISGRMQVEVLESGLHAVPFRFSGVGLRRASLDGKPAAIGADSDGKTHLFVEGRGRKKLLVEMVAPLTTSAAEQTMQLRVPTPAATRFQLTVPGVVEIKDRTQVIARRVDEGANVTRFDLLRVIHANLS